VSIDFAEDIVRACCVLHNFVRGKDGHNFDRTLYVEGLVNEQAELQIMFEITSRIIL
jgi:hypothetical protein